MCVCVMWRTGNFPAKYSVNKLCWISRTCRKYGDWNQNHQWALACCGFLSFLKSSYVKQISAKLAPQLKGGVHPLCFPLNPRPVPDPTIPLPCLCVILFKYHALTGCATGALCVWFWTSSSPCVLRSFPCKVKKHCISFHFYSCDFRSSQLLFPEHSPASLSFGNSRFGLHLWQGLCFPPSPRRSQNFQSHGFCI